MKKKLAKQNLKKENEDSEEKLYGQGQLPFDLMRGQFQVKQKLVVKHAVKFRFRFVK